MSALTVPRAMTLIAQRGQPTGSISAPDEQWTRLSQHWLATREAGFQPAWMRLWWTPDLLTIEAVLEGTNQSNEGKGLNARLWELGDVCEVFLRREDQPDYLEIHVSPENERLQLRWDLGGQPRLASGEGQLEDFMDRDPAWVSSEAATAPGSWAVRLSVPAALLGPGLLSEKTALRAAVCRYDYDGRSDPILSSTAKLTVPSFHRWRDWTSVHLA